MSRRVLIGLGAAVALSVIAPVVAAGQARATAKTAAATSTLRTPWGDPDLQGIWTTDAERSVPLDRPREFGTRQMLTEKELAERVAREAREAQDDPSQRVSRQGDPGAGPEHWYERSEHPSARSSLVIDPPDGRIPPLSIGGKSRPIVPGTPLGFVGGSMGGGPFNGPEDFHLADRCITRGLPQTWFPSAYNNGFQIVQSPGYVAILYERLHEHRIIPLDGRPALNPGIRQWIGDSRGRWDGDTLVVDVTNFSNRTNYRGSAETLRMVERYTRVDADTVKVEITVDDPMTWTRPWTAMVTAKTDPNYWQIFEYACHEGNYGLKFILEAARADDRKKAQEGTTPPEKRP